jgi:hypothetical protein
MKKETKKLEVEIRDLQNEEGMETLFHLSYDVLADGGRHHRERIARKVVDPDTEKALRRLFAL